MKTLKFIFIIFIFNNSALADNKELLQEKLKKYVGVNNFKIDMTIIVKQKNNNAFESNIEKQVLVKQNDNFYLNSSFFTMISTKNSTIIIDDKMKFISVIKKKIGKSLTINKNPFIVIEQYYQQWETVDLQKQNDDSEKYIITYIKSKNAIYRSSEIIFDNKGKLKSIINYLVEDGSSATIIFDVIDLNPNISNRLFDENEYIVTNGKNIVANKKYKNFVVNVNGSYE